jgi:hypothetical protein
MQNKDALARQEDAAPEVVAALRQLSHEVQAPPDFLAQVLAKADQRPSPRPGRLAWLRRWTTWRIPVGLEVAAMAVFVLAVVGAVPQYLTWFHTYVRGLPPEGEEFHGPLRTRGPGPPRVVAGASLPVGPWQLNASGQRGQLMITEVTPGGELRGTVNGEPMVGVWDEAAQQMTFTPVRTSSDPARIQMFTGYLFQHAGGLHGVGTVTYTLTGTFTTLAGPGAITPRTIYGWYAQKGVVE